VYAARTIQTDPSWLDADGIKIYTVSADGAEVPWNGFSSRLEQVKAERGLDWERTPAFVIFHRGASQDYLVLAWWGNDNELFTSVSVATPGGWVEDPKRYSFCLFDLEIFWLERTLFIQHIYCANPSLLHYRQARLAGTGGQQGGAGTAPGSECGP